MLNPIKYLNRCFDRSTAWVHGREAITVNVGHEGFRSIGRWAFVRWLIGVAALGFYKEPYTPDWLNTPLYLVLILYVVTAAMAGLMRAGAYRNGWCEGRLRLVNNIKKHDNVHDWLDAESNFDVVVVLGLEPLPRPDDPRWERPDGD